jgi:S1-C subfamily serine protease/Tfp pilus assembly protein PilF
VSGRIDLLECSSGIFVTFGSRYFGKERYNSFMLQCLIPLACVLWPLTTPPFIDIRDRLPHSTAWVLAGSEGRGTGVLVDDKKKWLLTCYHVVGDAKTADIVFPAHRDGKLIGEREYYQREFRKLRIEARVGRRDKDRDLALLELPELPPGIAALPLAKQPAGAGEAAYLLGNRSDLDQLWSFTSGCVRQRFRSNEGYPWRTERLGKNAMLLALQAPIHEGDSGGPVVSGRGELVGVASAILWPAQKTAIAVDLAELRTFLCDKPIEPKEETAADLYSRACRAAFLVQSPSSSHRATGFIFDTGGLLALTTAEATGPHERVEVVFPRRVGATLITEAKEYRDTPRIQARVIVRDVGRNLALLELARLPEGIAELPLAKESARPGEALHAIGNPNGHESLWLYSALNVRQTGTIAFGPNKNDPPAKVLILQAPGNGNDSGGPIFNSGGRVVALAGGKDGEQQVSYGIDVSEVNEFREKNRAKWNPWTAEEFMQRGQQRLRVHWLSAARNDFVAAARLDAAHYSAFAMLAETRRLEGEQAKAQDAIELGLIDLGLAPLRPEQRRWVYYEQARLLLDQAKVDAALDIAETLVRQEPKFAPAYAVRAEIFRRQKEFKKALADADEAVWLDANFAPAYLCRGKIHFDQKEFADAIRDFSRSAELEPYDPEPIRERGRAYREMGDSKKGEADAQSARKLAEQNQANQ